MLAKNKRCRGLSQFVHIYYRQRAKLGFQCYLQHQMHKLKHKSPCSLDPRLMLSILAYFYRCGLSSFNDSLSKPQWQNGPTLKVGTLKFFAATGKFDAACPFFVCLLTSPSSRACKLLLCVDFYYVMSLSGNFNGSGFNWFCETIFSACGAVTNSTESSCCFWWNPRSAAVGNIYGWERREVEMELSQTANSGCMAA